MELKRTLAEGRPAFLAMVVMASRHSPGSVGARLMVSQRQPSQAVQSQERAVKKPAHAWLDELCLRGTIGGGVLELRLLERARETLRAAEPFFEIRTYRHRPSAQVLASPSSDEPSGLICGGWQTHAHLLCLPERDLEALGGLSSGSEDGVDETVLHVGPEGLRSERLPFDSSRPEVEPVWADGGRRESVDSSPVVAFRVSLTSRRRIAVVGAGHCGQALAQTMARLGYRVDVFENRPSVVADAEQISSRRAVGRGAIHLNIVDDYRQVGLRIVHPEITPVVVMSTDFPGDARALEGLLPRPFPFVGVMGSPAKIERIVERLSSQIPSADLARLVAPIGLSISSRTPEEIAISVAAQILQLRGAWSTDPAANPEHLPAWLAPVEEETLA